MPPHSSQWRCHCKCKHDRPGMPCEGSPMLVPSTPQQTYNSIVDDGQSVRSAPPPYNQHHDDEHDEGQRASEDIEAQRGRYHLCDYTTARTIAENTKKLVIQLSRSLHHIMILLLVQPIITVFTPQTWVDLFNGIYCYTSAFWTDVLPRPITSAIEAGLVWSGASIVLCIGFLLTLLFVILIIGVVGCLLIVGIHVLWSVMVWLFDIWKGLV